MGLRPCGEFPTEPVTSEAHPYPHRRDWGGGGDDLDESTQRMIKRIWESLTDIRARMDQQAPVPPVAVLPGDGEAIPIAPVPSRVENMDMEVVCSSSSSLSSFSSHRQVVAREHRGSGEGAGLWLSPEPKRRHRI
ncbi:hypothetical protein Taro_016031 [Colocasia esculenta]|uniref:Uncharacterized protein n=1 Tax=Colocasia esculenta TaxID=4460 RepID=A0A843UJ90_COLES|nr:hypothetical protein [Colocasia esculenta]